MSTSSIRIKKICQWCGAEFEAQKVSTKYCSHRCANLAYKQATREKRVKQVEAETHFIKSEKPKENVKDKEYLLHRNIDITVYHHILIFMRTSPRLLNQKSG